MDTYLGRLIKNWAAKYPPPPDRRAELLRLARNQRMVFFLTSRRRTRPVEYFDERLYEKPAYLSRSRLSWFFQPFATSAVFTFDYSLLRPLA
jgi:hypothetical protein